MYLICNLWVIPEHDWQNATQLSAYRNVTPIVDDCELAKTLYDLEGPAEDSAEHQGRNQPQAFQHC